MEEDGSLDIKDLSRFNTDRYKIAPASNKWSKKRDKKPQLEQKIPNNSKWNKTKAQSVSEGMK